MSYDICFLVSRRCPGALTASSMTSWTETRAMTVPFCGSGQESKVFPRQSSANLPSKGGILKLNSRIHELKHFELYRRRTAAINELQNLKYLPRSNGEREVVVEDRTHAHADHVGFGFDRITTAAVGVLKAVRGGENHSYNRVTKDTVIFSAQSFHYLTEKLQLDLHEPPMSQVHLAHILNDVPKWYVILTFSAQVGSMNPN